MKTLYESLKEFTEEEVNNHFATLSPEKKALIIKKYGEDLKHPSNKNLSQEEKIKIGSDVCYMRKKLRQQHKKNNQQPSKPVKKKKTHKVTKPKNIDVKKETQIEEFEKLEQFITTINIIKSPILEEILETLPPQEKMIGFLYFGYNDDTLYSNDYISEILATDQEHVIQTTKNILETYKENLINQCTNLTKPIQKQKVNSNE